jgi:hypothetical protein
VEIIGGVESEGRGKRKERETLRGLTMGSIKMTKESGDRIRCVVVGDKYPCWLPHCGALGLEVARVYVQSTDFVKIIASQVLSTCEVQVGEIPSKFPLSSVVLVDGPATTRILEEAKMSRTKMVLSTRRRRRAAHGWAVRTQALIHNLLGGVTEKTQELVVHLPVNSPLVSLSGEPRGGQERDASTVLIVNEFCHLMRKIPDPLEVFPLRSLNLGTDQRPVYHGGGLLPTFLDRSTWVLTRCLSATQWGKRRVTRLEVLLANDYPEDIAKALLEESGADDVFVNSCPAVGCFISGAQPWLAALSQNEGGRRETRNSLFNVLQNRHVTQFSFSRIGR